MFAPSHVEVVDGEDAGRTVVGRNVVLAAGSVPRTLPGFDDVVMLRPGYAVEYDAITPSELDPSLETRRIGGDVL